MIVFIVAVIFNNSLSQHLRLRRVMTICFWLHAGIKPMTISRMTWPVLYIFIQRIKSEWELLAEPFLPLSERERSKGQRWCLLKAADKARLQIREISNKTVWDQHGDSALPSLLWIQSHLSYQEVRAVPAEETNQIVMDMKRIHIILRWQPS